MIIQLVGIFELSLVKHALLHSLPKQLTADCYDPDEAKALNAIYHIIVGKALAMNCDGKMMEM